MAISYKQSTEFGESIADGEDSNFDVDQYVDDRYEALTSRTYVLASDEIDNIKDSDWIKESSTASSVTYEAGDNIARFFSGADVRFEDTTFGGNFVINPRPQYTRYADIRSIGLMSDRNQVSPQRIDPNVGMGMYYNDAIHETQQTVHFRFGVPEYNSMVSFFTGFFDAGAARFARTGSVMHAIGRIVGLAVGLVVSVVFWPLLAAEAIGKMYRFFAKKPASKYYYMRPLMSQYWNAVTTMLNQITAYKGMMPISDPDNYPLDADAKGAGLDTAQFGALAAMFPDMFNSRTGYIDMYAAANRAQRMRNLVNDDIHARVKEMSYDEFVQWSVNSFQQPESTVTRAQYGEGRSLGDALNSWFSTTIGRARPAADDKADVMERHLRTPKDPNATTPEETEPAILDYFEAEWNDGSAFATFRVDGQTSVDESFSSSVVESDLAQKFNSISSDNRSKSFSMANGNIDGGLLTGLLNGVKGITEGVLSAMHLSGGLALAGQAFVDIPKHWDNSGVNLPRMNYTITMVSPYGNTMSQIINLYAPMCMLLAGALPISTGKQSYTSPFIVQVFDQGRAQTRLGIIDSLSFTRGITNLSFNRNKQFLSVQATVSIADLSSIMHMPMTSGISLNPLNTIFDEDTIYTDYLHSIANSSLSQAVYPMRKLRDQVLTRYRNLSGLTSPSRWASIFHDMPIIGATDVFFADTNRR